MRGDGVRKGYWYLSGFESYGLRFRLMALFAKVLYVLRLISDEDCKYVANMMVNTWLLKQAKDKGLNVRFEEVGGESEDED